MAGTLTRPASGSDFPLQGQARIFFCADTSHCCVTLFVSHYPVRLVTNQVIVIPGAYPGFSEGGAEICQRS